MELQEKQWEHEIESAKKLRALILESDDYEAIRDALLEVIKECRDLFDEDSYKYYEFDSLYEDTKSIDATEDDINFELDELYDLCDENNIWLSL